MTDVPYDPKAYEAGCQAKQDGRELLDCPYFLGTAQADLGADAHRAKSWFAGWHSAIVDAQADAVEYNGGAAIEDDGVLICEIAKLKSIVNAAKPYMYAIGEAEVTPSGPRVVFMCRLCGGFFKSDEPEGRHHDTCPLATYAIESDAMANVPQCPRCHQTHHHLAFFKLKTPSPDITLSVIFTHWGMCPITYEPILFQQIADSVYYVSEPDEGNYYA